METPNFWSVIPASVRYDPEIPPNAKLLYSEITALSNRDGYCTAKNEYFSSLYGVSKRTVSDLITRLTRRGYIRVDIIRDARQVIQERRIYCAVPTPFLSATLPENTPDNPHTPIAEICDTSRKNLRNPIAEICADNIRMNKTRINNTPIIPKGMGLFETYADGNPALLEALKNFDEMRRKKRKPMTDRARQLLLGKLDKLAKGNPEKQIQLLDQSILKCWDTVYPLDEDKEKFTDKPKLIEESWCQDV